MNNPLLKYNSLCLFLLSLLFISSCARVNPSQEQPNILVIVADDHRWDMLGKYHPIVQTPTLDALANQGAVFKNAFVTTPICAASRASILTGLYERTHGQTFREPPVPEQYAQHAYPQHLKSNGYVSGFIGKYGTKLEGDTGERFDYFAELKQAITNEYEGKSLPQTYYMAELAKDFMADTIKHSPHKPWVLSVSFWDPHAHDNDTELQYHYPEELESLYSDVTIPDARLSSQTEFDALPGFIQKSMSRIRWEFRYGTPEIYQRMVKRYYRAITGVDKAVGMMRQQLDKLGIADNTVIIYIGDNGYNINERQLAGKWLGWEEHLRVPLIIYDPREKQTRVKEIDHMALNVDLASTIAEFAGLSVPSVYQGLSLVPLVKGDEVKQWRDDFFFEHKFTAGGRIPTTVGMRTEHWKYVRFTSHDNYEQLYDLNLDPGETINLADNNQYQSILTDLRLRTDQYIEQYQPATP